LRGLVRSNDTIARSGGDEFAILMPETRPVAARVIANKIEESVRHHTFVVEGQPLNITVSLGIALFPQHGSTAGEVLSNADLAMYQAKNNGRSRTEIFRPSRDWKAISEQRLQWRNLITEALRSDGFVLFARPIRSLKGAQSADYELLLRLPSQHGGLIRPGAFLGVAEEFGLIQEIDRWVVQRAIAIIAKQEHLGAGIRLAVNLSGKSFGDSDLLAVLKAQLASTSIDPTSLVAEVTETAAI